MMVVGYGIFMLMGAENIQSVNLETFYSFIGDDEVEGQRMAHLFIQQSQEYLKELKLCLSHQSGEEWHDVAHKFKGMAGFAGAEALQKKCLTAQKGWKKPCEDKKLMFLSVEKEAKQAIEFFENL